MKKRSVHGDVTLPTHHQAAKISEPRAGPLDLPPPFIPPQLPSILQGRALAVRTMRTDQVDPSLVQPCAITGWQSVADTGLSVRRLSLL